MVVKGLCLNDLHFGLPCSERIFNELSQVLDFIRKNDLDVIHINGDYFDRKLSFGEPAALMAMKFFYDLRELCIKKKIKLRIIHGTMGHERGQTEMFRRFASKYLDMKIFNEVSEEELFPGFNVLYVPEEYPVNAEEYYRPYREKVYNAIFMHCMWDFIAMNSNIEEGDRTDMQTAPVFKYNEWAQTIPHGMAICGHIHARHVYKKKIFYPGSFSAWNFSDISEKGFTYYTYDTEKQFYKVSFINNTMCPTYGIISANELGLDLEKASVEEIMNATKALADKYDYSRLDIESLPLDTLELLKRAYKEDPKIKLGIKKNKNHLLIESNNNEFDKYSYILNGDMSIVDVILRFIKEDLSSHEGADKITKDDIVNYLKEEEE